MDYKVIEGDYQKMGVTRGQDRATFTFHGEKEDVCSLILIQNETGARTEIPIPSEYCLGSLRSITVMGLKISDFHYCYSINEKEVLDDYAPVIIGREIWNDPSRRENDYRVYGAAPGAAFSWKNDRNPEIAESDMIMYKLHVRGFSMDRRMRTRGTFRAAEDRIESLKSLGITTLELMPVYEFEEMPIPKEAPELPDYIRWDEQEEDLIPKPEAQEQKEQQLNYWGYVAGNYFAVKASYASRPENASAEFKHLIRTLHENGMECVMEFFFPQDTNHNLILDALRYWVREYHVDGFHLLGQNLPITAIVQDIILSRTKIFYMDLPEVQTMQKKYERLFLYREEYQYPIRKMLNHINGNLAQLVDQQRKQGHGYGYVNFVAGNNGFTLADVFMYNDKHNEANGEDNSDGDNWNFSHNYGAEGPSRRKAINEIRFRQWKNAMALLMLAQGVPLIWSGDECGNSQMGNNNAYCQDNPTGWVNWKRVSAAKPYEDYLTRLIAFRKKHPILTPQEPFTFADRLGSGFPDLSYHGSHAWISDADYGSMSVGMLYNGAYAQTDETEDVYVAYNFYSEETGLAIPQINKKRKWYLVMNTALNEPWLTEPEKLENQQFLAAPPQSVCILIGR